jgi:hypothetical protein
MTAVVAIVILIEAPCPSTLFNVMTDVSEKDLARAGADLQDNAIDLQS